MNRIDVHHHVFPERYVRALKEAGVEYSMGGDLPEWTPDVSLRQMDKNQIRVAMPSITAPDVYFPGIDFPDGFSEELARIGNELIGRFSRRSRPKRIQNSAGKRGPFACSTCMTNTTRVTGPVPSNRQA